MPFQKGHKNYNINVSQETKEKLRLSKLGKRNPMFGVQAWNKGLKGIHLSPESEFKKGSKGHWLGKKRLNLTGEKNYFWKGDKVGYFTVHSWLKRHFGKANKCENSNCLGISKSFQWALIKGKKYIHERGNFWMLCASCHKKYDRQ